MDLYQKVEHADGSVSFKKLETPPSFHVLQLMADYRHIAAHTVSQSDGDALIRALCAVFDSRYGEALESSSKSLSAPTARDTAE